MDSLTLTLILLTIWFVSIICVYVLGFRHGEDLAEEEFYGVSSTKGEWN